MVSRAWSLCLVTSTTDAGNVCPLGVSMLSRLRDGPGPRPQGEPSLPTLPPIGFFIVLLRRIQREGGRDGPGPRLRLQCCLLCGFLFLEKSTLVACRRRRNLPPAHSLSLGFLFSNKTWFISTPMPRFERVFMEAWRTNEILFVPWALEPSL